VRAPVVRVRRVELEREPEVHRLAAQIERELEPLGHHPEHGHAAVVELDGSADHPRVAAEPPPPEPVAEHCHARPAGAVLFGPEDAPACRADAENGKDVGGHEARPDALGCVAAGEIAAAGGERAHALERAAQRPVVGDLRLRQPRRRPPLPVVPDHHHPLRLRVRERAEEDAVDDAEDRRVRPDAQRQRQHRHGREAGAPTEGAPGVADVLKESVHGDLGRWIVGR
jgi:hypothetical protein